uniref:Uncharacterized protein n=1 Tax=Zea mays TaxID=4577 RepID=C0P5M9_MAIZE|nr:unknown [Zea mays]
MSSIKSASPLHTSLSARVNNHTVVGARWTARTTAVHTGRQVMRPFLVSVLQFLFFDL